MSSKASVSSLINSQEHRFLFIQSYEAKDGVPTQLMRRYDVSPAHCLPLSSEEVRVVLSFKSEFNRIGVECSENMSNRTSVLVHSVPACIMEKDYKAVKRMRESVSWWLIEALIKEHVELLQTTGGAGGHLPQTLHKCLCSQACHGAVKFGECLSMSQCEDLLHLLSRCQLPFQCAHGRPSVTPLLIMDKIQKTPASRRPNLWKISRHNQPK